MESEADIRAAEILGHALYELNGITPDDNAGNVRYASDNTYQVRTGKVDELSPYAHVGAALMVPLTRLAGSEERAWELRDVLVDNDCNVRSALEYLGPIWAEEDSEQAAQESER
jgi:hypothetical protein